MEPLSTTTPLPATSQASTPQQLPQQVFAAQAAEPQPAALSPMPVTANEELNFHTPQNPQPQAASYPPPVQTQQPMNVNDLLARLQHLEKELAAQKSSRVRVSLVKDTQGELAFVVSGTDMHGAVAAINSVLTRASHAVSAGRLYQLADNRWATAQLPPKVQRDRATKKK